jgi:RNA polymerase sigma-70 factor, ECF subfamily
MVLGDRKEAWVEPAQEAAWVERAKTGDAGAFEALILAYGALVHRVIGRLSTDPDDSADLVQETFLRAWQGLPGFTPGAPFRPWLLAIALNAARDAGRRRRRRPPAAELVDDLGSDDGPAAIALPSPDPTPEAEAEAAELRFQAERAFARLSPDAQAILWLRVREDLSYDEIATVLGIPRGTVMSRLARAREALRIHLEEDTW